MKIIFQLWHELKSKLQTRDLILRFREREIFLTENLTMSPVGTVSVGVFARKN